MVRTLHSLAALKAVHRSKPTFGTSSPSGRARQCARMCSTKDKRLSKPRDCRSRRCRRRTWSLTYRALDAFSRGDFDALLAMFYEDVEVFSRLAPLGDGSYRGHDGVRSWWQNLHDAFPDFALEALEVRDLGDVTLGARAVPRPRWQSGAPIDETFWQVAHWRDGKVIRYSSLRQRGRGPRSRGAVGVGDVAGERGVVRAASSMRSGRGLDGLVELTDPEVEWQSAFVAAARAAYTGATRACASTDGPERRVGDRAPDVDHEIAVGDGRRVRGRIHLRGKGSGVEDDSGPATC